jgi:hypothetical protein
MGPEMSKRLGGAGKQDGPRLSDLNERSMSRSWPWICVSLKC